DLGRRILRGPWPALTGLGVLLAALLGWNPVLLLIVGGLLLIVRASAASIPTGRGAIGWVAASTGLGSTTLVAIFLAFLKFGAVSFGSGYVLLAFLHADVVQTSHWAVGAPAYRCDRHQPGDTGTGLHRRHVHRVSDRRRRLRGRG